MLQKFPMNVTKVPYQCYKSSPSMLQKFPMLPKCPFFVTKVPVLMALSLSLCRYKVGHFLSLFLLSLKLSSKGYSQLLVMIFQCLITILTTTHCFNFLPITLFVGLRAKLYSYKVDALKEVAISLEFLSVFS